MVLLVGLTGAFSTHAETTIAPAIVAVRTTKVRICELLTRGDGASSRDSQSLPPFSPPCNLPRVFRRGAIFLPLMPASRSRFAVIFFTVLIDLIGFGIVMPILPFYAQRFGASGLAYGAVLGVYSFMQFVATALLGKLSDRIGRRPVLLTTMLFNALGYALFAFAGSYWVLFLSRVVSGFAGGNISAAQAYIADITSPAERSRGMGIVGAAFGIGFSIGPAIGGFSAHYLGATATGLVAVGRP